MHPISADYSLLSWCPDPEDPNHSPDVVSAKDMNWHPPLTLRKLNAGATSNACFWLSLAAALTRSTWGPSTHLRRFLRSFDDARKSAIPSDVRHVRDTSLQAIEEDVNLAQTMNFHLFDGAQPKRLKAFPLSLEVRSLLDALFPVICQLSDLMVCCFLQSLVQAAASMF